MVRLLRSRAVSAVALVLALSVLSSCNTKERAVDALLLISNAAISANQTLDANGKPLLSTADTGAVLTVATQALQTIQASANGWQASVKVAWAAGIADFTAHHPQVNKTLAVALAAVTAAVDAL